jgi:hypothetical protein
MRRRSHPRCLASLLAPAICLACVPHASAGPPFITDDPEPTPLGHWEAYVSSMLTRDPSGLSGTLPHIEMNYGAAPNLQVHLVTPCALSRPSGGSTARGYGDTEIGVKFRFVQEGHGRPMVGMFPLIEVPTGDAGRGLSSGHLQFFVPIWIQKSWGPWTTYGGGGYFVNPGSGNRNFWLVGWEGQKDLNEHLTLGAELYYTTPAEEGGPSDLSFNVGGQYNFDDHHHLLWSVGRSISGDIKFASYVGHQWTW